MVSKVSYGGWENCVRIENESMELIVTTDVGPRIISCRPTGYPPRPELFKQFKDQLGGTAEPEWKSRGGHRLWHAPEVMPRTYYPDNKPILRFEHASESLVAFIADIEEGSQIQKKIGIKIGQNKVTVDHWLVNWNEWEVTLAPWALTVMAPGGTAIIPLPEKRPHPEALEPDFPLVMWPYVEMNDPRYYWGKRFITLSQNEKRGPTKIGLPNIEGWSAYLLNGYAFIKYFEFDGGLTYPDHGCNFETFTNKEILELESLGPLETVGPREQLHHTEQWAVTPIEWFDIMITEDYLEAVLVPLVNQYR